MLVCHTCLRRYFGSFVRDRPPRHRSSINWRLAVRHSALGARQYLTSRSLQQALANENAVTVRKDAQEYDLRSKAASAKDPERAHRATAWGRSRQAKKQYRLADHARGGWEPALLRKFRRNRKEQGEEEDNGDNWLEASRTAEPVLRHAKMELPYLKDPVQLAERVKDLLSKRQLLMVFTLVRLAGKQMQCTVSWNHILNHLLRQGTNTACKAFNEVPKRQKPC